MEGSFYYCINILCWFLYIFVYFYGTVPIRGGAVVVLVGTVAVVGTAVAVLVGAVLGAGAGADTDAVV